MRDKMSRAHLLARTKVVVEGDGSTAAEEPPHDAPRKREIKPGVDLVPLEPGIQHLRVPAPDLAQEEESLREFLPGPLPMLLPEGMVEVLDRVQPETVDAGTFRPSDLCLHQEVGDLGQLEIGRAHV